ncbi:MAG: hypothetical protein EBT63_06975 [Proteobacteria bacterium]|nr:hypothetical protein [Pseudomonadota bacterium]
MCFFAQFKKEESVLNLGYLVLTNTNLNGAFLMYANLSKSDLSGADLS